jgi:glutamate synthase (NADPH/NADH) small chain
VVQIKGSNKVEKIECIKTELIKKEGEAREVPVDIEGSNYEMPMDYVVMAVGSKTEESVVKKLGVELTSRGNIKVDENYMTSKNKVFAGGDLSGTKATVAWASRSGREASNAIMRFLEK